ncbi:mannitol dehydrogenase family protein [Jannaschia sp. Os4]|uniref:mannitol dehydrogenase family protein n=1 Tax=Jannaschia sp. Os4 TaxID=2807617 RepID=UPI001EEF1372|nr:mannitol dehydrogenase family protein [Jannaschia sp. Os4]
MKDHAPIRPSRGTLDRLPEGVARPAHDPAALTPGIVHVGVGNFHRAHMGVYLDRLFDMGRDHDWGIVGAGVRPGDAAMRERLAAQDWMTTVVELEPSALDARVIAPMTGFAPVDPAATVAAMADPAIRIVSLTVTEGGYFTDAEGAFDEGHPEIVADAAGDAPKTVFGMILAALRARRAAGHGPFTVMSCDNLQGNGHAARQALEGLARMRGEADLLDGVSTPNGMVDCITPATDDAVRAMVSETFGVADAAPVVCEPFRQWVLEDDFAAGRPALEAVGVEFVDDVVPYELMKLRVLNAGHAALAYPAALLGHHMVHDAMADADIRAWVRALIAREAIPTLAPIPGVDPHAYLDTCLDRFANARVGDTVPRLCFDGSGRQPQFVLPTLRDRLAADAPVDGLALEVALWRAHCATAEPLEDPKAGMLRDAARHDPAAFLALEEVFGDLGAAAPFAEAFASACATLDRDGPRAAIRAYAA